MGAFMSLTGAMLFYLITLGKNGTLFSEFHAGYIILILYIK